MAVTPTTWNPADKYSDISLDSTNLIASRSDGLNAWRGVRSIFGASTDAGYYCEFTITQAPSFGTFSGQNIGVGTTAVDLSMHTGSGATGAVGWAYARAPYTYYVTADVILTAGVIAFGQGDIISVALKIPNLWWAVNGVWVNGGDPSAGTGAQYTNLSGTIYVISDLYTAAGGQHIQTANFGASAFTYTVPTGFNAGFGAEAIWTITATAGANGSISPSGAVSVTDGGSQTFTVTSTFTGSAATAFIKDVLVDSVSAGRVVSYAFTNVTADHTISASFLAWPDAKAIETVVREIINETTPAHFTDAMILNWTNEAVRDIAIKTSCIEAIFSATTTSGSRLVPITGHKVRFVEYIPASGNRVGLQAIIPKSLGRLPFNGITPQYWFQWGADIVIDPEPTAAYSLNLYTASWPDYLMSDLDDEPLIDVDFQILILAYVLSKALIRRRHFATAAVCYQLYVSSLNKLKARRIKRRKDNTPMLKLPDALQKGKGSVNV